jgi:hypothetical protein
MRRTPDGADPTKNATLERRRLSICLNAWQRLGVVLSVAWAIVSLYWDSRIYDRMYSEWYDDAERSCEILNPHDLLKCAFGNLDFTPPSEFQARFVLNATVPIILGWILAYLAIAVAKWILAGRENSN